MILQMKKQHHLFMKFEQNKEYTQFLEFEILESEETYDFNEVSKFISEIKNLIV